MKIKIIGKGGLGWSIDKDRFYNQKAMLELKLDLTNSVFKADIIYSIWYSYLLKIKFLPLRLFKGNKKIVTVVTNNIEDNTVDFEKYRNLIDFWVCANSKQKKYLISQNIKSQNIFFNPYYVDEKLFFKKNNTKEQIARILKIDYQLIKDKFLIGSFQCDSQGKDLTKQKWHKNPKQIIEIFNNLDKNKYILILAGPRRYFIINECKKHNIPYIFVGNETFVEAKKDDMKLNVLPAKLINILYNLIDLYLVTSVSEGGPKAVLETSLSKTPILSTNVGMAKDLLSQYSICETNNEFLNKIRQLEQKNEIYENLISENYEKVSKINNFEAYKKRIKNIIETVAK